MTDTPSTAKKSVLSRVIPIVSPRPSNNNLRSQAQNDISFFDRWFKTPVQQEHSPHMRDDPSASNTTVNGTSMLHSDSSEDKKADFPSTSYLQTPRRKFSLLSRGAVAVFLIITLLIVVILAVVLPITLRHHHIDDSEPEPDRTRADPTLGVSRGGTNASGNPLSPTGLNDPSAYRYSDAPVRLALLTNFPDPAIYFHPNTSTWYAFGTNGNAGILNVPTGGPTSPLNAGSHANIQIATSKDFISWVLHDSQSDPLPNAGAWTNAGMGATDSDDPEAEGGDDRDPAVTATHSKRPESKPTAAAKAKRSDFFDGSAFRKAIVKGTEAGIPIAMDAVAKMPSANVWAPDVIKHPTEEKWLMYYSAVSGSDPGKHHCIGASVADSPAGPYQPNDEPIACPVKRGGAIDPVGVVDPDDNRIYVVYKIDGNSIGHGGECNNGVPPLVPTPIMLQRMETDGVTPDGSFAPVQLLDRTKVDGPLIEAPAVIKAGDIWYMFYSSGCTRAPSYDVRYATARNLTGPWERHSSPLFKTGSYGLLAPGSVSVRASQDDGPYSGVVSGDGSNETTTSGWKLALHARVRTNKGGVRSVFTVGLKFDGSGGVTVGPGFMGEKLSGGCTGSCAA